VRLEDWQKFIESQFIEDQETVPSQVAPQPDATPLEPITSPDPTAEATPEPEKTESVQIYPSFVNSDKAKQQETVPVTTPVSAPVRSPFVPITLDEAETPEFGAYLPSYAVADAIVHTLVETAPAPTQYDLNIKTSGETLQTFSLPKAHLEKRVPKSRARHQRKTLEPEPLKELSTAELWSSIPKYLETLQAMERTDEAEVAQYSYKSPFLEKRRELIQRIFDPELTLEETARLLCVCPTTIRRYTNRGILRCFRKAVATGRTESAVLYDTRQRRFRLTDILLFLETHCEMLDNDRRHDAKTLYAPQSALHQIPSQESDL